MDGDESVQYYDQDTEFEQWVDEHPNGFVLNGRKIHESGCRTLKGLNMTRSYEKACATNREVLLERCRSKYGSDAETCAFCTGRHMTGEPLFPGEPSISMPKIATGFAQAERGELMDGDEAIKMMRQRRAERLKTQG